MTDNKALISKYIQALSGKPKPADVVDRYVADAALAQHIAHVEAAFPEYEILVEETIAERDLVAVQAMFRGVHRGTFAGIEPTGKAVSAGFMIVYRVENGKIVQHWMEFDRLSLLEQLQGTSVGAPG